MKKQQEKIQKIINEAMVCGKNKHKVKISKPIRLLKRNGTELEMVLCTVKEKYR